MHLKMFPELFIDHDGWFNESDSADVVDGGLKRTPVALSDDGWADDADRALTRHPAGGHAPGDLVLYRFNGELVPAALIEPATDGFWLARDSRHGGRSFYLAAASIATRTPRRDFPLDEAA